MKQLLVTAVAILMVVSGWIVVNGLSWQTEVKSSQRELYIWSCEVRNRQVWDLLDLAEQVEMFGDEKGGLLWRRAAAEDWEKPCKR